LSGQPPDAKRHFAAIVRGRGRAFDRSKPPAGADQIVLPRAVDLPANTLKVVKLTFPGSVVALPASRRQARQAQSFA
jgi:hypothetical protein